MRIANVKWKGRSHKRIWHAAAIKYARMGLSFRDVATKIEDEFGLEDMYDSVRCFLRRKGFNPTKFYAESSYRTRKNPEELPNVELGMRMIFDPWYGFVERACDGLHGLVVGTVVYVHKEHLWFTVEWGEAPYKLKKSFKFRDIGESVGVYEEGLRER